MSALSTNAAASAKGNPVVAGIIAAATPYFDSAAWAWFDAHQNDSRRVFGFFTVRLGMFRDIWTAFAGPDPNPPA